MKLMTNIKIVAAAALLSAASAASAATFNFLGQNLSDASSRSYTVDGIGVTVTAGTFSYPVNPSTINFGTRRVDVDPDGIGADGRRDGDQIDGSNGNDVLVFTFDTLVTIEQIAFRNVDRNDDFSFGAVSGTSYNRIVSFQDVANPVNTSDFGGDFAGMAFGIGAIGRYDNFTIAGLTVSAVPIPAAGGLLLAGLGGLAMVGRRRRKAA